MDEMIYNLFLRSRTGITLFGLLRYQLTGFETTSKPADGSDASTASMSTGSGTSTGVTPPQWLQLTRQQRPPNIDATVYRVRGTLSIPFLTGMQAVAVEGVAFLLPSGQPLVTFIYSLAPSVGFTFNQANSQQIGGGLQWDPTNTAFGTLGRRVMLPA